MDLSAFVAARVPSMPRRPKTRPVASGLLALDADRVSVLIEQWRATSNRAMPLTYAEFCAVMGGNLRPSDAILRAWDRLPLNRMRSDSADDAAYLRDSRNALLADLTIEYESRTRAILTRFAGQPATAKLYAAYLATAGRSCRRAFFRRVMPVSQRGRSGMALHHGYLAAGTGQGKSELLKALIYEHVCHENGVVVFDPHGDMIREVARWPEVARSGRLVYLDPYLAGPEGSVTPVLNPVEAIRESVYQDEAVGYLVNALQRVVGGQAELTQRMMGILRTVLPSIARKPGASLIDLWAAMGNPKTAEAEALRELLATYAQDNARNAEFIRTDLKDGDYNSTRNAIRGRLQYLFSSAVFTRCVTGPSTVRLRREIDRGAIILIDLSGHMGAGVAADWGKFLLSSLFAAAMSRQDIPLPQRKPCFAYIDEADAYLNESIEEIYKNTRKFRLFLTIAQQIPGAGMTDTIRRQVFGNSDLKMAGFSGDPVSAKLLAELTGAPIEAICDLRRGEFVFRKPRQLYRASVRRDLRGSMHSITDAEWEAVKAQQIRDYYRDHGQVAEAHAPLSAMPSPLTEEERKALERRRAVE